MKLRVLHQTFLHANTYILFTQTHLDTDAFIHRRFYTQAPLHTTLSHADVFTHMTLLHRRF